MTPAMSSFTVNGTRCHYDGPAGRSLLGFLRADLGLTGAKPGCGEGECGACTVLVDGVAVLACQTHLDEIAGRSITTIEGLAVGGRLHPVQQALVEEGASQCGYCTPGMALRAAALLSADADPDDRRIADALGPGLCRCGCYPRIMRAVHRAATWRNLGDDAVAESATTVERPPVQQPSLGRPRRPWDLCEPADRDWFDVLGDGLVAVWPPVAPPAGTWATGGGAWVHIGPSAAVTAFSGKVDVGQDNTTAFRLLVAEELAVDPGNVIVVLGDTDLCPFDMGTFGSRSMPDAGEALRRAAAGARQALVSLAAERWGVACDALTVVDGAVLGGPDGVRLGYGLLVGGVGRVDVLGDEPTLTAPAAWRVAGRPGLAPARLDAVTGARRYASDLDRPGLLHGAVLRPPEPGAALRALETGPAERLPGVTVVRDGAFVAVAAGDPMTARRAVAVMAAVWDPPPAGPGDVAAHLRDHPAAGEGWQRSVEEVVGDVDAALAAAATRVDATYTTAYIAHAPLETRAALAEWEGDRVTVWTGTQVPFGVRAELALALDLDEADVRVIVPPTGSAFGGKHRGEVAVEAARLARAVGRPVKVHWSRAEEFQWGYLRPMAVIDIRAGLDDAGSLAAWDLVDINAGAAGIAFPYRVRSCRLRYQPAASPVTQGSYRALAATANTFARESHIDELAHAAGADPLQFRLRHLDDDRLGAVVRAVADRFGWGSAAGDVPEPRRGRGIAAGVEKGARVATCAEVCLDADGTPRVTRLVSAYECGAVVNPDTVVNQIEGGTIMALGGALFETVALDHGRLALAALASYRVPRFGDIPQVEVVLLDRRDIASAGAGETPLLAVAPAIANAIFSATGRRLRSLPLIPDEATTGSPTAPCPGRRSHPAAPSRTCSCTLSRM